MVQLLLGFSHRSQLPTNPFGAGPLRSDARATDREQRRSSSALPSLAASSNGGQTQTMLRLATVSVDGTH